MQNHEACPDTSFDITLWLVEPIQSCYHACSIGVYTCVGTSLLRTPSGHEVSRLLRGCPNFRGCFVHFSICSYRTVDSVLIKGVSLFQRFLLERFHCIVIRLPFVCNTHCMYIIYRCP